METLEIVNLLKRQIPEENIKINEPMKNHTSFKIGGPAEIFIKVKNIEELKYVLNIIKENNIPLTVLGNGSNILVSDKGIRGIVAKIEMKEISINNIGDKIELIVDSGVQLGLLAQKVLKQEMTGFEELSGIPGTIGGAVVMNAGAHGKEIKDIITEIIAIDYNGNIHKFTNEESKFQYRRSMYSEGNYIILQAKFLLEKGKTEEIKAKMTEYQQYRKEKQPIEYPSAGSTFKRGEDFITAKLIDEAGLKGYSIGGAQISEKHAGFIINKGNATAQDVIDLVKYTKEKVYEKFDKKIDLEIKVLGE